MTGQTATEQLLRRDRLIVGGGLAVICLLSWAYLLIGAGTGMSTVAMTTWQFPPPIYSGSAAQWPAAYWIIMAAMWWVMMVAMMVPSAAPMILLYARVLRHNRKREEPVDAVIPTGCFLLGYLFSWLLFSLAATLLQWQLEHAGLVHGMMMWSNSHTLSAAFLILAGLYQLTPLKSACLHHCRLPAAFLTRHWREGKRGAHYMGFAHGLYCVGCCWPLMLLLFAGGIMNLVWIAGLAILVLLEKVLPRGELLVRGSAILMLAVGVLLLAESPSF